MAPFERASTRDDESDRLAAKSRVMAQRRNCIGLKITCHALLGAAAFLTTATSTIGAQNTEWARLKPCQAAYLDGPVADDPPDKTMVCLRNPRQIALLHLDVSACPHRNIGTIVSVISIVATKVKDC